MTTFLFFCKVTLRTKNWYRHVQPKPALHVTPQYRRVLVGFSYDQLPVMRPRIESGSFSSLVAGVSMMRTFTAAA
jgi:hypothetical protein